MPEPEPEPAEDPTKRESRSYRAMVIECHCGEMHVLQVEEARVYPGSDRTTPAAPSPEESPT